MQLLEIGLVSMECQAEVLLFTDCVVLVLALDDFCDGFCGEGSFCELLYSYYV